MSSPRLVPLETCFSKSLFDDANAALIESPATCLMHLFLGGLWAEAYVCLYRSHLWIVQIRKKDPLYNRFLNPNRLFFSFFFFLHAVIQWHRLQDEVSRVDFIEERCWRSTKDKEINRLTDNSWKTSLYFHVCSEVANSNVLNWVNKYILRWYSLIDMLLSALPTSQEAWEHFDLSLAGRCLKAKALLNDNTPQLLNNG